MRPPSQNRPTRRLFHHGARILFLIGAVLLAACATRPPAAGGTARADHGGLKAVVATIKHARLAYRAGRYVEAMRLLTPLARAGNAGAQYTIGYLYYYGYGTNRDPQQALKWIRRAAARGNARAITALRTIFSMSARSGAAVRAADPMAAAEAAYRAGDYRRARADWLRLAENGECRAQLALARMHEFGIGVSASFAQAARWYHLALQRGCPNADAVLRLVRPRRNPPKPGTPAPRK
ncbi:sel1 repeat protein [bacterium BMS3Bbin12]|nr:sel1 repeat protein [bacterium BMS3Abin12]GBE47112.1 sel1 repeat protein [bacterium BMS3Bbin12]GBE51367.1 sel1 repeat protein [bacterium BMS3Bbin13]HDJ86829.1 sel1 repeat family protein [Chromatiales bacterium]